MKVSFTILVLLIISVVGKSQTLQSAYNNSNIVQTATNTPIIIKSGSGAHALQIWGRSDGHGYLEFYDEVGGGPQRAIYGYNSGLNFTAPYHKFNGNVGIGGEIPSAKLHVQADANTSGASENSQLVVGGLTHPEKRLSLAYNTSSNYAEIQSQMYAGAYSAINLNPNGGNVGIGTTTPDSKLSVNGKIRAHEIKVETANWPDYVFAKDYTLPSLAETEKYIKEKGHLPGIPSAADVKADGIDLGDMNARLLKKIEELTLHLIEQSTKISKQEEEDIKIKKTMNLLLSEIDVLKKKVK